MEQLYLLSYDVKNLPTGKQTFRDYLELYEPNRFEFLTNSSCILFVSHYRSEEAITSFIQKKFKKYKLKNDLTSETYLDFVCAPCLCNLVWYSFHAS